LKVHYVIEKNDIYRFDDFEVDPARRRFSRNGAQIPLYPKAFDILVYLVSNPGRAVTKEEIFKSVWPESFVYEGILATQTASSPFPCLGPARTAVNRYWSEPLFRVNHPMSHSW
jgi:hypothetical protein